MANEIKKELIQKKLDDDWQHVNDLLIESFELPAS